MDWIGEARSWASRLTNTRACFSCSRSVTSNERARSFPSSNIHPFRLCYSISITRCLLQFVCSLSRSIITQGQMDDIPYLTSLPSLSFVRNDFQVPFRKHYKLKKNKRVRRLPQTVNRSLLNHLGSALSTEKEANFFSLLLLLFLFFQKRTNTVIQVPLTSEQNRELPMSERTGPYCIPYLRRYPWRIIHS